MLMKIRIQRVVIAYGMMGGAVAIGVDARSNLIRAATIHPFEAICAHPRYLRRRQCSHKRRQSDRRHLAFEFIDRLGHSRHSINHFSALSSSETLPVVHKAILEIKPIGLEFLIQSVESMCHGRVSLLQQDPAFALWTV